MLHYTADPDELRVLAERYLRGAASYRVWQWSVDSMRQSTPPMPGRVFSRVTAELSGVSVALSRISVELEQQDSCWLRQTAQRFEDSQKPRWGPKGSTEEFLRLPAQVALALGGFMIAFDDAINYVRKGSGTGVYVRRVPQAKIGWTTKPLLPRAGIDRVLTVADFAYGFAEGAGRQVEADLLDPRFSGLGVEEKGKRAVIAGTFHAVGGVAGARIGGHIGFVAGAAIGGSLIPVIGAPVGAAIGYALGSWAGGQAGEWVGDRAAELLYLDPAAAGRAVGNEIERVQTGLKQAADFVGNAFGIFGAVLGPQNSLPANGGVRG